MLILILSAVIPAIFLLVRIYRADRLEQEPAPLLLSLVVWGILATVLAMGTETFGEKLLASWFYEGSFAYDFLLCFVVVACSEEGFKYLLLKWRTWKHPAFNCQFDGVVYAVFVSLGFALWENIGYVINYGFGTAVIRALTAIPGHACFGVFMGAWYGYAKKYENFGESGKAVHCRRLAFLLPALAHGFYDFAASYAFFSVWVFFAFIAVLFFISFRMVRRLASNDSYIERTSCWSF